MIFYPHTALTTATALLLYFLIIYNVGRARRKYNIPPPAITGNPEFERVFRVQQNTAEWLVLFLPALWLFAVYVSDVWAGIIGAVWVTGRLLYAVGYYKSVPGRLPGFLVGLLCTAILLIGALIALVRVNLAG